ncbi:hypothetical protein TNCV_1150831 [Trichonephila clavipes]|nr:hypothetical protein TNCV_1150831 [Trichonephila clavipes]
MPVGGSRSSFTPRRKDEEHPIEYASRLLSSSERNYSTKEKKLLQLSGPLKNLEVTLKDKLLESPLTTSV